MAFYTQNSGYFGKYASYFSDFPFSLEQINSIKQQLVVSTLQLIMVWGTKPVYHCFGCFVGAGRRSTGSQKSYFILKETQEICARVRLKRCFSYIRSVCHAVGALAVLGIAWLVNNVSDSKTVQGQTC
ncbi:MAG: hypothetical protein NTW32_05600 [Chloroflexi bacterium]|nr:hypothetical protein [Chloroflexota bacterium]